MYQQIKSDTISTLAF